MNIVVERPQERTWGMLTHLTALSALLGIPFGNIVGPLIVWLVKKDESPFVDDQGKESLNFQISIMIYLIIPILLSFILIGIPIVIALVVFDIVMVVIASAAASNGETYRYPLTLRLIQ